MIASSLPAYRMLDFFINLCVWFFLCVCVCVYCVSLGAFLNSLCVCARVCVCVCVRACDRSLGLPVWSKPAVTPLRVQRFPLANAAPLPHFFLINTYPQRSTFNVVFSQIKFHPAPSDSSSPFTLAPDGVLLYSFIKLIPFLCCFRVEFWMNYAPIQCGLIYYFTSERGVIFLYFLYGAALVQHASSTRGGVCWDELTAALSWALDSPPNEVIHALHDLTPSHPAPSRLTGRRQSQPILWIMG